jgi:DNA invertase Pin-like site-specific DNA recombinase
MLPRVDASRPFDGYIRVSQVRGREGDSFISPDLQRQQIERWAQLRGVRIGEWHTDLDQTGGKMDRPALTEAIRRIEQGLSAGLAVARWDRFARTLEGALQAIARIDKAGGALASVADGIDPTTSMGKFQRDLFLLLAEFQRNQIRDNWKVAQEQAVGRGIHIASKVPTGYMRDERTRKLVPHPQHAPHIAEAYRMRASGDSWRTIADYLDRHGVKGPYGAEHWRTRAVQHVLSNRVYLGEARSGEFVNEHAHDPLIDRSTWEVAQVARGVASARSDEPGLLTGLLRCAGCRYLMKPDKMTLRDGTRARIYRCRGEHAAGICKARASTLGHVIEPHVEALLFEIGEEISAEGERVGLELGPLEEALDEAERDLAAFRDDERISKALGIDRYVEGLEKRAAAVKLAHRSLAQARLRAAPAGVPLAANLGDIWPDLAVVERQKLLGAAFDSIFLRRGRQPIEERVVVFQRGEGPADLPRRGKRVPLRPLDLPRDPGVAGG